MERYGELGKDVLSQPIDRVYPHSLHGEMVDSLLCSALKVVTIITVYIVYN